MRVLLRGILVHQLSRWVFSCCVLSTRENPDILVLVILLRIYVRVSICTISLLPHSSHPRARNTTPQTLFGTSSFLKPKIESFSVTDSIVPERSSPSTLHRTSHVAGFDVRHACGVGPSSAGHPEFVSSARRGSIRRSRSAAFRMGVPCCTLRTIGFGDRERASPFFAFTRR